MNQTSFRTVWWRLRHSSKSRGLIVIRSFVTSPRNRKLMTLLKQWEKQPARSTFLSITQVLIDIRTNIKNISSFVASCTCDWRQLACNMTSEFCVRFHCVWGVFNCKQLLSMTEAEIRRTFDVNTIAPFWVKQKFDHHTDTYTYPMWNCTRMHEWMYK